MAAPGVAAESRSGRRRRARRGPWVLLAVALLCCLAVAAVFFRGGEETAEIAKVAAVDRPASSEAPGPPVDPARARAVEELDERLGDISRAHPGVHGAVVFDPLSGQGASLNVDRRFVAASLSKLYALLTLYSAASRGEVDLEDEITMRASDVWAEGTGVLYNRPVGSTMTLRECATFLIEESDNTAEVMLNRYLGEQNVDGIVRSIVGCSAEIDCVDDQVRSCKFIERNDLDVQQAGSDLSERLAYVT